MLAANGDLKPHYRRLFDQLSAMQAGELPGRVASAAQYLQEAGVYYRDVAANGEAVAAEHSWPLAFPPLILDPAEWTKLETGLLQRATFLERLLADVYSRRQLVQQGVIPGRMIAGNKEFMHPLAEQGTGKNPLLSFIAIDLGRMTDGRWHVLSDRTQAPSGAGFALENRVASGKAFPELVHGGYVQRLAEFFIGFRDELQRVNQAMGGESIGVLTPGPMSETYFEHSYLARYLAFQLVEGGDLFVQNDALHVRTVEGARPICVLWRRLDADYADPLELYSGSRIGTPGLLRAVRSGRVHFANALGAGILETPELRAFQPAMARALLGEELQLPVRHVRMEADGTEAAQEVQLSTAPIFADGRLEPHPVTLRVFLARHADGWRVMPGGFARIAGGRGLEAAAIRAGGHSVDVWIPAQTVQPPISLLAPVRDFKRLLSGALPSRAADNLFWLGRYTERMEQATRLIRLLHSRAADGTAGALESELQTVLASYGMQPQMPVPGLHQLAQAAYDTASRIRERFSPDGWRVLSEILSLLDKASPETDAEDAARLASRILTRLAGFIGLVDENMYRLNGWKFLQCGRRIERGITSARTLATLAGPDFSSGALDAILELADSRLTYRRRYSVELSPLAVLDLAVLDPLNPRSIMAAVQELADIVELLPGVHAGETLSQPSRRIARLAVRLRTADAREVDPAFLQRIAGDLADLSELLTERYFTATSMGKAAQGRMVE
ncbi:circularly permuted type 2 ATP-grasp protein [Aureimonas fodinaquatilis]|uniref:Circularly permuted type 2 ATP-grasp protein n=2 Tax=Aureimonas fodinaquatilis TaxID=2565783 RepID=A0A5B0DSX2_9HYPH|nr:circularly permuted type 2 ATP-grasp protein [Aureimonas fodinaquatilis]